MNEPHSIQIEITKEGEVKATVENVAGPQCGPLSAFLDELGVVVEDDPTEDFYASVERDDALSAGR